ncbi:hypothetical protein Cgig2_001970 [Carnegiea gigantea]|uniref:ribulose-bisphosphate carboxylase n=1 Tax=Carnegiea gigantea TaxID=171969 RepID=A0A9Q1Q8F8_9CARY|nr:hypothetical protein Cgig2_001970 [Carnegiea gigantea]
MPFLEKKITNPLDLLNKVLLLICLLPLWVMYLGSKPYDLRILVANIKTFQGLPHSIQVERDQLNKYGRPLLRCTIKPKLGLDFTKDDENVNSQPFMHWRDRFLFCTKAIYKAQAQTDEIKGHNLNATACTYEEMIKRVVFARELGVPIKNHGIHYRVLAKALRLSSGDHIHAGTVVGKLEGERDITLSLQELAGFHKVINPNHMHI